MTTIQYISQLPAASAAATTDLFPVTQGSTGALTGTTRKLTVAQLFTSPTFTGLANAAKLAVGTTAASLNGTFQASGNVFGNSSTALPQFKSSFSLAGGYTGSGTNGLHLHELLLQTGNYTVGTAGTLINTYIGSVVGGSLATGDHVALQAQIDQTSATANLGEYIIAGVLQATANSNAGGTAIATNGSVFGTNVIAQIKTGATYFNTVIGTEIDIVAKEAVLDKIGLALVPWVGDTTSGSRTDALLVFGRNASSSVGMDYGAVFGSPLGWWPIKSTGTLIGAPYTENASLPPGPAKQAAYGIDFSPVTFSSGAFRSNGFLVDGSGNITTGSSLANYLTLTGAASASYPTIAAAGSDTNIDALVVGKGTGRLNSTKLYVGPSANRSSAADATLTYLRSSATYSTTADPGFTVGGAFSGTVTSGQAFYNSITINSDTVDPTTGSGPAGTNGFYVGHTLSAGAKGGRVANKTLLNVTGAFTASASGDGAFQTALGATAQASASAGGTAGAGNARGNLFGSNIISKLTSGAGIYWNGNVGLEINVASETGTQAYYKHGLSVIQLSTDAVSGVGGMDSGLMFATQTGGTVPGWDRGITFGHGAGWWPIKSTGTLIGTLTAFAGSPAYAAANGVDFSSVTFSTSAFKSTGFTVDGSGNTTVASAILGAGGPEIITGSGVPASTKPKGSLYLRTGGAVGSTLYVSQGGGTWNAVAGV